MRIALCAALLVTQSAFAQLVDPARLDPSLHVQLGYATADNFTHHAIYPRTARCFLRREVAERLVRVQASLRAHHVGLALLDCYRPPAAQRLLWAARPDPRYVADPQHGSRHSRGAAVDVTLVDDNGNALTMPSAWDDATERAHRDFSALPADVLTRRSLLEAAMRDEGFVGLPTEWWHFDASDWPRAPLLAWDFTELDLPEARQLVVIVASDWDAHTATLARWERKARWTKLDEWPVEIGHGLGWGRGLQAAGLARLGGPTKHEGDRRSPAGIFALTELTGYANTAPTGATLPYRQATSSLHCVDDPNSADYNRLVLAPVSPACVSTEPMLRTDVLYARTVFVAQNPDRIAGAGSCVFLHVHGSPGAATLGCTTMPLDRLEPLIGWLEPGALLVQLPRSVYEQLANAWGLGR